MAVRKEAPTGAMGSKAPTGVFTVVKNRWRLSSGMGQVPLSMASQSGGGAAVPAGIAAASSASRLDRAVARMLSTHTFSEVSKRWRRRCCEMEELILPSQRHAFYCGLTVKVLLLAAMETVNLSK